MSFSCQQILPLKCVFLCVKVLYRYSGVELSRETKLWLCVWFLCVYLCSRGQWRDHCGHHPVSAAAGHSGQCALLPPQEGQDPMRALGEAGHVSVSRLRQACPGLRQRACKMLPPPPCPSSAPKRRPPKMTSWWRWRTTPTPRVRTQCSSRQSTETKMAQTSR